MLKALGFTQRQLAASVAWQSSVAALVGVVVGVPAGIALGRWLWTLFADGISAVPHPTVPALSIALVALGAVVFANLVALVPGASPPGPVRRCCCGPSEQRGRRWQGPRPRQRPDSRHDLSLKVCCG